MTTTTKNSPISEDLAEALGAAIEKLRAGVLDEAHKLLVRLIRKHSNDADVIFNLAVARKRLGYDVSAEALFSQAFDRGYHFPSETPAVAIDGRDGFFRWTDSTGSVSIVVHQKPRRSAMTWVEFADTEDQPESEAATSDDDAADDA